jgi:hypothetical protein|tara:strand:- start:110 stop:691 length:582 start_codon:yes stop_codon:yes gene_type:complete
MALAGSRTAKENSAFNPSFNQLNASGDSSSCEFIDWFFSIQNLTGMWTRAWVFNSTPQAAGGGALSGCPSISFTYVDVNFDVQVNQSIIPASYCSGGFSAMDIDYISDSDVGGWGLSGTFWTTAAGITRRKALITDVASNCSRNANVVTSRIPGAYTLNTPLDTSSQFNSNFMKVAEAAQTQCPNFDISLVQL